MSNQSHPKQEDFMSFLQKHREDRGTMADLRCALIPGRESRAWSHLAAFCDLTRPREKIVFSTVAAAFAIAPDSSGGNMGTVLRKIACENNGQKGLETFKLRFQRILACSGREELADQLHGIFRAAKQRGIAVNHNSLFDDLWYWNDRVKLEWAQSFWGNANHD